jgi:hypothetical protein
MYDKGFDLRPSILHSARFEQPMYRLNLGNKVGLLGACIKSNLDHVNVYEFWPHEIQSWLRLIKMLRSFFYKDLSNIIEN